MKHTKLLLVYHPELCREGEVAGTLQLYSERNPQSLVEKVLKQFPMRELRCMEETGKSQE